MEAPYLSVLTSGVNGSVILAGDEGGPVFDSLLDL